MTDKEMLEYAAKAAGIKVPTKEDYPWAYIDNHGIHRDISCGGDGTRMSHWNPLTDDGDALRLVVKLNISIGFGIFATQINCEIYDWAEDEALVEWKEDGRKDPLAATRRAIVRAAAEVGRKL